MKGLGVAALAAAALGAAPAPAVAMEDDAAALEACLASGDHEHCVGAVANPCMDEPGGATTVGMAACAERERRAWDMLLNADWPAHRKAARAADALDPGGPAALDEALLDAQRAWIAFRDAECALEYAAWGAGSMRGVAGAFCLMEMTADRVTALRLLFAGDR